MIYFAYGSNLSEDWLSKRCPSARFLFTARLDGFTLAFTRTSQKHGCGVADIVPEPGGHVWGVVYHLNDEDRPALDRAEGVGVRAYEAVAVTVHPEGDLAQHLKVTTYVVVTKADPRPRPSAAYLRLILEGATHWRLPADYLERLRARETQG